MSNRYGHKSTAINGIMNFLIEFEIETEKKNCYQFKDINKIMIKYRESKGEIPSKNYQKNAEHIQKDFKSFVEYCKANFERAEIIRIN